MNKNQKKKKKGIFEIDTHSPQRQNRSSTSDNQPNPTITNKILQSTNKKSTPDRQDLTQATSQKANTVTKILSHAKPRYLLLIIVQRTLDHRGYAPKQVPYPSTGLNPHCCHKHQPSVVEKRYKSLLKLTHRSFNSLTQCSISQN